MENILKKILLLSSLFLLSCENDIIERNEKFPALDPINVDLDGGTWLPILLNAPDEFSLPEPIGTNTPNYTREINEIKSYKIAKYEFTEELNMEIIKEIVVICDGDPTKSPLFNTC